MSAVSIPEVKATIRQMQSVEAETLVARVKNLPTASDVRAVVTDYVFSLMAPKP